LLGFLILWEPSLALGGRKANLGAFAPAVEDLVAAAAFPLLAADDLAGVVVVAAEFALGAGGGLLDDPAGVAADLAFVAAGALLDVPAAVVAEFALGAGGGLFDDPAGVAAAVEADFAFAAVGGLLEVPAVVAAAEASVLAGASGG
jgi:hypothetical protein